MRGVYAKFGGIDRHFLLTIGTIGDLETERNASVLEIARRVFTGRVMIADVEAVLRLSLVGGGVSPPQAKVLVETHLTDAALLDPEGAVALVVRIFEELCYGPEGLDKIDPDAGNGRAESPKNSQFASSAGKGPSSAGRRRRSKR